MTAEPGSTPAPVPAADPVPAGSVSAGSGAGAAGSVSGTGSSSSGAAPVPHWPTPAPAPAPAPVRVLRGGVQLLIWLLIGAAVAVALGVYGAVHEPTGIAVNVAGFSGPLQAKVWLATGAFVLALLQLFTALGMWNRIPGLNAQARWLGPVHRWSGRLAFLLAVPVAVHCLYAVGFQYYDTRVLVHSIVGCLFFGAFTTKMIILPKHDRPWWVLPTVGGVVFSGLVVLWLTSSVWFFTTVGVEF